MSRRKLGSDVGLTVTDQDIYELSDVQKYRLGTRISRGDRVFKYGKATSTLTNTKFAAYNTYQQCIAGEAAIATASPIGSDKVYVTVGAGDGIAGDGVFAAHALEGGYILIHFDGAAKLYSNTFLILDNDAATSGNTMTITIDGELPIATVVATSLVEAMGSPYLCGQGAVGENRSFVGLPMRLATTALPYLWLQTWGPCWIAPQQRLEESVQGQRAVFRHDGSIDIPVYDDTQVQYGQHAGILMSRGTVDTLAPFFILQISV